MIHIALTGNVAAGKSSVARLFHDWGATVIDSDQLVREVQAPGTPVLAEIAGAFGAGILLPDGTLDRAALRRRILGDDQARRRLEAIVHPAVERQRERRLEEARRRGDRLVVSDIPLLFEVLDPAAFDAVVLVDAPEATRLERLVRNRGLDEAEARRLIASQLPSAAKRQWPGRLFIIDNDGDTATLEHRAREVWEGLNAHP
ncbi:MAG: dephospho-CoA kinase [Gemmatimonadota bacterium]|nr:dephospho-CoA kinase [Gemmatimonadota bacterium]